MEAIHYGQHHEGLLCFLFPNTSYECLDINKGVCWDPPMAQDSDFSLFLNRLHGLGQSVTSLSDYWDVA